MKKWIVWFHKWISIIFGLYFVALGLSGSYITYPEVFESWLRPDLYQSATAHSYIDLNAAISKAQHGLQTQKPPMSLSIPDSPQQNIKVTINTAEKGRKFEMAFIDPTSMTFKGKQEFSKTPAGFLFIFHHDLFSGRLGHTLVGIGGLLLLVVLLTGLYWWWPKNGKTWKQALTLPTQYKSLMHFSILTHKVGGAYSLVLMIFITLTGIYVAKPDWFSAAFAKDDSAIASSEFQIQQLTGEDKDKSPFASIEEWLRINNIPLHPLEIRQSRGSSNFNITAEIDSSPAQFTFNPETHLFEARKLTKEEGFEGLMYRLHAGQFWSFWGRIFVFISGLLPLFFFATGIYIWLKKPKKKLGPNPAEQRK